MPEPREPVPSRHRIPAVAAVEARLLANQTGAQRLTPSALARYAGHNVRDGWRLDVRVGDRQHALHLLLDQRFPRTPPRVALVDRQRDQILPHVEEDGLLCLLPDTAAISMADPAAVVAHVLGEAVGLLESSEGPEREHDLRREFINYWSLYAGIAPPETISLLTPQAPSRIVSVWCGAEMYVAGEDSSSVLAWLAHRFARTPGAQFRTDDALLLWLDSALLPSEYPRTAGDVHRLAIRAGTHAVEMLEALADKSPERIVAMLASPTSDGACLAVVTLHRPPAPSTRFGGRGGDPLSRGFRPGRVPPTIQRARYFGSNRIRCGKVERVDASWVHGRGNDMQASRLFGARVVVLGCGSIGAPVALALAEAGVGTLRVIDPDALRAANAGRHPLGLEALNRNKAVALAESIKSRLPHITAADAYPKRWDLVLQSHPEVFENADLIVSTMGTWSEEGALNEWHLAQARRTPIVYGWTEAYACAGHAVAITATGGCLQCGLDAWGSPLLRVTNWQQTTLRAEPGCSTTYQPYGPVELMYVTALVAESALDCLLGIVSQSTERIWAARHSRVQAAGGSWTNQWKQLAAGRTFGGMIEERPWPRAPLCPECGESSS